MLSVRHCNGSICTSIKVIKLQLSGLKLNFGELDKCFAHHPGKIFYFNDIRDALKLNIVINDDVFLSLVIDFSLKMFFIISRTLIVNYWCYAVYFSVSEFTTVYNFASKGFVFICSHSVLLQGNEKLMTFIIGPSCLAYAAS